MKAFAYFGAITFAFVASLTLAAIAHLFGAKDFVQGGICGMALVFVFNIGLDVINGRFP